MKIALGWTFRTTFHAVINSLVKLPARLTTTSPTILALLCCLSLSWAPSVSAQIPVVPAGIALDVKVLLQGGLIVDPDSYAFTAIMRDDMRSRDRDPNSFVNFLPATEPYTALSEYTHVGGGGGETVSDEAIIFADNGNDSVVDWVFIELRSAIDNTIVLATRSGLVQRDGDVVDVDGISLLTFTQSSPGNYFVSVNHRNHIGVMTATAITLDVSGTTVDFRLPTTSLWHNPAGLNLEGYEQFGIDTDIAGQSTGTYGASTLPINTDLFALWAGNTTFEQSLDAPQSVSFSSQSTDVTRIFHLIDCCYPGGGLTFPTYISPGYTEGDVNLDGSTIFAGQNSDTNIILSNVDQHPRNILRNSAFIIPEQLPK